MKVKDGEEKAPILNFINFGRCVKVAFVAYADFESVTEPVDLCEPNHNQSFNEKYQKHKPIGFAYNIVCFDENVRYRSSDQLDAGRYSSKYLPMRSKCARAQSRVCFLMF